MSMSTELHKEIRKKGINWEKVDALIRDMGEKINEYYPDENETMLSDLYEDNIRGKDIVTLTRIFLHNGYDVKGNNGFNGFAALKSLCWSKAGYYTNEAAELLMDAGADPHYPGEYTRCEYYDDDKGVLGTCGRLTGDWMTGAYYSANVNEAYYEMIEAYYEGRDYHGIRSFGDAVGCTVSSVYELSFDEETDIEKAIVLECNGTPLVITWYVCLMVNPYIYERARSKKDVSGKYHFLLGKTIRGLSFCSNSTAMLKFTDGSYVILFNDKNFNNSIDPDIRIMYHSGISDVQFVYDMPVEGIYLEGARTYSSVCRMYDEETIILKSKDNIYRIWTRGNANKGKLIMHVDTIDKELLPRIEMARTPLLKQLYFDTSYTYKVDGTCAGLRFVCEEGYLYIGAEGYASPRMALSGEKLESMNLLKDFHKKMFKQIEFTHIGVRKQQANA